jgi:Ferredoxin-dependent bilin reductase
MTFQYLIEKTGAKFAAFSCQPIELPPQFSKIERLEQDGILTLENHFFRIADIGQLRIAHTHAPKINIIAIFFFPEYAYQLPVYSMEFVMLGQKPIIALMDTVCLMQQSAISTLVKDFMDSAHSAYPEFSQEEMPPQWFEECRSGHEFFNRPRDMSEFATLGEIHLSLVENVAKLFQKVEVFNQKCAALHKTNLENYKKHHKINSPGIRLMNRSFGEDWTNEYLTSYLFG